MNINVHLLQSLCITIKNMQGEEVGGRGGENESNMCHAVCVLPKLSRTCVSSVFGSFGPSLNLKKCIKFSQRSGVRAQHCKP